MLMRCYAQRINITKNGQYLAAAGYNSFVIVQRMSYQPKHQPTTICVIC